MSHEAQRTRRIRFLGLALATLTLAVYAQALDFDFVIYDDPGYVTLNAHVRDGLTWDGALWAFTAVRASNWHPLTWLSHMLDSQLFGLTPGGHHGTSVLLHIANALLLFGLLLRGTGAVHRSALVAALFALHPLRVESVAWVAERKDVLCAFLGLLSIHAYLSWVRRGGVARYALVALLFVLGLMAKPMLVTIPIVLLLLDHWPLRRLGPATGSAIAEKIPLFLLSLASAIATFLVQRGAGAVTDAVPAVSRAANAAVSYVAYLAKTVWPTDLAVLYTHPDLPGGTPLAAWEVVGAILLLAGITTAAIVLRRHPYVAVGWLWYVVMLVPVIGLVQIGRQSLADRYTYLPTIGLLVAVVWGAADTIRGRGPRRRRAAVAVTLAAVAALGVASWRQARTWRDSVALFEQALRVSPTDPIVRNNLGVALARRGRAGEARVQFREALRIDPDYDEARRNLARTAAEKQKGDGP